MRRRFLLVHNPTAGLNGTALLDRVVSALERRGATVARGKSPGEDAGGFDAVIAAGGDGTIRTLAASIEPARVPLGIIPTGTGNVFATEIGLRRRPDAIADVLIKGPAIEIEGARANGTPFFLMAGAGFDGDVIRRVDLRLKQSAGKSAYVAPILASVLTPPAELRVTVDGASYRARWAVAARARHYGGPFVISREAGLLKPGLQAVLFRSPNRLVALRQLLALGAGLLHRDRDVVFLSCRTMTVEADRPVPVQIDGDRFDPTPLHVEADGPRVRVIVPPGYPASERAAAR
jgi:diacylglycerol kinase family enzyme